MRCPGNLIVAVDALARVCTNQFTNADLETITIITQLLMSLMMFFILTDWQILLFFDQFDFYCPISDFVSYKILDFISY